MTVTGTKAHPKKDTLVQVKSVKKATRSSGMLSLLCAESVLLKYVLLLSGNDLVILEALVTNSGSASARGAAAARQGSQKRAAGGLRESSKTKIVSPPLYTSQRLLAEVRLRFMRATELQQSIHSESSVF
jgi:hypothetical protein